MTPRLIAYELLIKAEKNGIFSNIALDKALAECDLSELDKSLTAMLFYGVTERKITLDHIISKLSSRPICDIDRNTLIAIRLGIYQLRFLDKIPAHAAINETVELCSKKTKGFVNAILREYTRKSSTNVFSCDKSDFVKYLSVTYSVCEELAKKLVDTFDKELCEDILRGFDRKPETTVCVNTLKISRDELTSKLSAEKTDFSQRGLYVKGAIRSLYGFDDGLFFVQDQASQICVEVLDAKENDTVIDVCACPGSKTFGAAITMNNKGKIYAFDLHENKLSLINSCAARLGIDIIEASAADGRVFIPELEGVADRVLCDVPCSGFGVLAKKPELRYKKPKDSERLPGIQLDILNNACKYVKRGGSLVYSTCTILPEENENNVKLFLASHPEFSLCEWNVGNINATDGMMTFYPHIHKTDGFFIAKLKRK